MAKIAIVGVGAIGGVVAALLQQAGRHEVTLCTRRPLSELSVETPDGTVQIDTANVIDSGDAPMVDWVMVATKVYDVAGAAKWLERLCAKGAPVAVLQNGVEHRERFAPYIAMQSILPVVVDCPAERRSPNSVIQRGAMHLKVPESVEGSAFVDLFRDTAADASVVADFKTVAWRKLCFNSAGVLSALLLQPAGVMHGEAIGEVARQIVLECIAVGRAEGAQLGDEVADDVLRSSRSQPVDSINSIYADRLAGRPVEIDARNGVIVRLGEKHGIPTPNNRMAVALLQAMTQS
jgi:2-dehydropantoate 2-reductase